ncbi:hypothetical protein Q3G72_021150 [Acer saccharum]|nr:hypothetical protein Q3G72_021150 [Acer saccharum]
MRKSAYFTGLKKHKKSQKRKESRIQEMLVQSSAPSSVEAAMPFASNLGKRDLLCEWVPAKTWQDSSNCGKLPSDGSELLTADSLCTNSGMNLARKRRKLQKNSAMVFPVEAELDEKSVCAVKKGPAETVAVLGNSVVTAPATSTEACNRGFGLSNAFAHSQRLDDDPCSGEKCSRSFDDESESQIVVSDKEHRCNSICLSQSGVEVGFCNKLNEVNGISKDPVFYVLGLEVSCKLCGNSGNTLNMLLCDHCDEAFHTSCCNPRIEILPTDSWFCHHCSNLNCKVSLENSFLKSSGISWSKAISRFEMGPIALMLKYPVPHNSRVRIGESFQAEVPDWSDQISSDVDCIGEPLEMDLVESVGLKVCFSDQSSKNDYVSNWLQCQEVLHSDTSESVEETICGKWRRAPFYEVQTNDWDCSCSVRWDPFHSDCAVPQELETSQVLKHVKYVDQLRSRLAVKS